MLLSEGLVAGLHVRERVVPVPLDHADDASPPLDLFVREVVDPVRRDDDLPLLVFLQGGPGGRGPRPLGRDGWLGAALERFRVLLVDQRGTGRSSRVQGRDLARFDDPVEGARFLTRFGARAVVDDLEHLRATEYGGARWSTLGQSYGGFLTLTYLSRAPQALAACYVAGGLAGLTASAQDVYAATVPRMLRAVRAHAARHPGDAGVLARVADRVAAGGVVLPDGDPLTVRRLQLLGHGLGMGPGSDRLHWLLDDAFARPGDGELSDAFLAQVAAATSYDENPLYMVLQEAIYGQGAALGQGPTGWAAAAELARHPEFAEGARPLALTGEVVLPWMVDEIRSLRPFAPAAHALAAWTDHEPLYDPGRLAANEVPVAAVVYDDDLYVDAALSRATAASVGALQLWTTNEFAHDGLHGARVAPRLLAMVDEVGGRLR